MNHSKATTPARVESMPMTELLVNLAQLNNWAMMEVAEFMAAQSPKYRARVIERCSAIIGAIAELDAGCPHPTRRDQNKRSPR
jgi:hypothetical protein